MRQKTQALSAAILIAGGLVAGGVAAPALAQDLPAPEPEAAISQNLVDARITIGAGASIGPSYFGSDDYEVGPWGTVRFDYLRLPGGLSWGSSQAIGLREGIGLRGTARFIGSRRDSDHSELRGLDDVDVTLELGLGLGYESRDWRAFTDVRYGFGGHESFVAVAGADAIFRPTDSLILNVGPRADFGTGDFMRTYFGVTADESAASGLDTFRPSGGLTSVGIELGAHYAIADGWGIEGVATYDRLVEDAADSPITALGSEDQFGFRLGVTRSLSLGF